jgi:hypothetical protein
MMIHFKSNAVRQLAAWAVVTYGLIVALSFLLQPEDGWDKSYSIAVAAVLTANTIFLSGLHWDARTELVGIYYFIGLMRALTYYGAVIALWLSASGLLAPWRVVSVIILLMGLCVLIVFGSRGGQSVAAVLAKLVVYCSLIILLVMLGRLCSFRTFVVLELLSLAGFAFSVGIGQATRRFFSAHEKARADARQGMIRTRREFDLAVSSAACLPAPMQTDVLSLLHPVQEQLRYAATETCPAAEDQDAALAKYTAVLRARLGRVTAKQDFMSLSDQLQPIVQAIASAAMEREMIIKNAR